MAISTAPVPVVYGSWIPLASTSGPLPWAMANGPPTWAGAVAIGRRYLLPRFTSWHVCGRRLPGCLCPGGCNAGGLACLASHALPSERYQGDGVFCRRIPHPTSLSDAGESQTRPRRLSTKKSVWLVGPSLPCTRYCGKNAFSSRPSLCHSNTRRPSMSEHGGKTYRPWEPQRYRQEAHSPEAKLPEGDLVFFLLDTVPQLELSRFYAPYEQETWGAPPFDPAMLVCLLLYAYCVGVFSSRKVALACERNLAFMAIVGEERPDFRTISDFRKQHLEAFKEVFVQVVRLAGEAGLVQLGNVSTDGTKMQGNASRHKAMSYGYMQKEVERLREDIEVLVTQAYQQDEAEEAALGSRRGDELPAELARREERLARIEAAMQRVEAQAKTEAEAERQRRAEAEAERKRTGQQRRGKAPKPVEDTPDAKAQMSFTDPELHIMRTNNKGWEYCGNAQVSVDGTCQIILACDVTDAPNDKQQAEPLAQAIQANLAQAGIK